MSIILYDIPSTLPEKAWSPSVWKARFCLNLKELPYTTEWVEYPDIEPHCQKLGIPPTAKKPDGSPFYTLPAIHDSSTGVYISDSVKIAEYLEKTYPGVRSIFSKKSAGIQTIFDEVLFTNISPLLALAFPDFLPMLTPESTPFMTAKVLEVGSKNREEDWIKAEEGMEKVAAWYERKVEEGPFVLGACMSWVDIVIASFLVFFRRTWGEDSEEWRKITSWNGGRWGVHSDIFREFEAMH
ncbi:hypothetical protein CVT25_015109 [Psilocybe cyanescens]|uniref:GST N-terminal domain-containing protein n=1 Tax=Psilocybe cyanescens TaxID=93625 RepID=A0A409WUL9_PSICY|nr:hypothetical protein CVT25_015109 [Psilocybe cyanescens]